MTDLVEFLTAHYDRIEKRERGRYTVSYPLKAPCPGCGQVPGGFESGRVGTDETRLEPCGHEIPNTQFVDLYAKSSPDPFVLADLESKRRLIDPDEWAGGPETEDAYEHVCRVLAAPFSAEPGYDGKWAV